MSNTNLLPVPRNKYQQQSRFLNIKTRNYGEYAKTLEEIQQNEIERMKQYDATMFEFFQIFTNQNLILAKQQTPNLKKNHQFKTFNQAVFGKIIGLMLRFFINDTRGVKKLKITSEMINTIFELKESLMAEINQQQIQQEQKTKFGEKFKQLFSKIFKKKTTEPISQQVKETEQYELTLLMDIFTEIISSFKSLHELLTDTNICFFLNAHFELKIGEIFSPFSEFKREQSLINLQEIKCNFNLLSFAIFLGIEPLIVLFLLLGANVMYKYSTPTMKVIGVFPHNSNKN